jgi:hypothetical protein
MSIDTYGEPDVVSNAIGYAMHSSRSHNAVIHVYDEAGNVIETRRSQGQFQRLLNFSVVGESQIDCKIPSNSG